MLGFCGEPSGRAGEFNTRVEVLNYTLDSVKRTGGRNAMNDDLMPDLIIPKTSGRGYGGSDGFINGRTVSFEDREGRSIVFGDELDVVTGGELYCSNKSLLKSQS